MVLVDNGRAFLLMKRHRGVHKGQYVPVGGHIEPYETPLAAAIRETKEESGIDVKDIRLCGIFTETSPAKLNDSLYCYHAKVSADTRFDETLREEGVLKWVEYSRFKDLNAPPTDYRIYQDVLAGKFFVYDVIYDKDMRMLRMSDELTGRVVAGECPAQH